MILLTVIALLITQTLANDPFSGGFIDCASIDCSVNPLVVTLALPWVPTGIVLTQQTDGNNAFGHVTVVSLSQTQVSFNHKGDSAVIGDVLGYSYIAFNKAAVEATYPGTATAGLVSQNCPNRGTFSASFGQTLDASNLMVLMQPISAATACPAITGPFSSTPAGRPDIQGAVKSISATSFEFSLIGSWEDPTPESAEARVDDIYFLAIPKNITEATWHTATASVTTQTGFETLTPSLSTEFSSQVNVIISANEADGQSNGYAYGITATSSSVFSFTSDGSYFDGFKIVPAIVYVDIAYIAFTTLPQAPTSLTLNNTNAVCTASVIGYLSTVDPVAGATHTYTLNSPLASGFSISGDALMANQNLPSEPLLPNTYTVSITTTSTTGGTLTDTFSVTITGETTPTLALSSTTVDENQSVGTVVGAITPANASAYYIISDTPTDAFAISGTNMVTGATFNFEDGLSYSVDLVATVLVCNVATNISLSTPITVNNLPEQPEFVLADRSTTTTSYAFTLLENATVSQVVGLVYANDSDANTTLTYSLSGSGASLFDIVKDSSDQGIAVISVAAGASFDVETTPSYSMTVTVTDSVTAAVDATLTITIGDVNEAPVLDSLVVAVNETSADDTLVTLVAASDQDLPMQTLNYAIVSGNANNAFRLDPDTSRRVRLVVNNATALNHEATMVFNLTISVTDPNGLSSTGAVDVVITDINDLPTLTAATFVVAEDAAPLPFALGSLDFYDEDSSEVPEYSIVSGAEGKFTIDSSSGVISVAATLDFETQNHYSMVIKAHETIGKMGVAFDILSTANVSVTNVNEAPTMPAIQTRDVNDTLVNDDTFGAPLEASDVDNGDSLTFSLVNGSGNGTSVFNVTDAGQLFVTNATPLRLAIGDVYTATVRVTDYAGLTAESSLVVTVIGVNSPPTFDNANAEFSIAENAATSTVVGTVSATDPDGLAVSYSLANTYGGLFAIGTSSGTVTLEMAATLDFETTPSYTLDVIASDGRESASAFYIVNVTNSNEAPTTVFINGVTTASIAEDASVGDTVGTLTTNDPDAGDTFTFNIIAGNTGSAFAVDGNLLKVAATFDFETLNTYALTVNATDAAGLSGDSVITISVTNVNEAPTGIAINSTRGTVSTSALATNATAGTLVGTVVATGDPDTADTHSCAIAIANPRFDLTNNVLTIQTDLLYGSSYDLTLQCFDTGAPQKSVVALVTVVTPAPPGLDVFFYISTPAVAGQPCGMSDAAWRLNIVTALEAGLSLPSDSVFVTAFDSGDVYTLRFANPQAEAAVAISTITDEWAPAGRTELVDFCVTIVQPSGGVNYTVNYRPEFVTSLAGTTTTSEFNLTVAENSVAGVSVGTVYARDVQPGTTLTFSFAPGGDGNGQFTIVHGAVINSVYAADIQVASGASLDYETMSTYTLILVVSDSALLATPNATVNVALSDVNDAPILQNIVVPVNESATNGELVTLLAASDQDVPQQTLSYSITAGNTGTIFGIAADTVDPTRRARLVVVDASQLNFEALPLFYNLTIEVSDTVTTSTGQVDIVVSDFNDVPTLADETYSVAETTSVPHVLGTLSFSDEDGQTPTYAIDAGNTDTTFSIGTTSGVLSVVKALNFDTAPSYTLTVRATESTPRDGVAFSTLATVTVNVDNGNHAPVVVAMQTREVDESASNGDEFGAPLSVSDGDSGDTLTWSIVAGGGNGTSVFGINATSGVLTVANAAAISGNIGDVYFVTVAATDAAGANGTAEVQVTVGGINLPPVFSNNATVFALAESAPIGTVVGVADASDPEKQGITYTLVSPVSGPFSISGANGTIYVSQSLDFETTTSYALEVMATDGGGATTLAQYTVTVSNVNEAPAQVLIDGVSVVSASEAIAVATSLGTLTSGDPDAGAVITYAIVSGNVAASLAISGNTLVVGADGLDYETTPFYALRVSATDQHALSVTSWINVTVVDVNEAADDVKLNTTTGELVRSVNAPNITSGQILGTVVALGDPEEATQTHTCSLLTTTSLFAINGQNQLVTTGQLTATTSYELTVQCIDNGTPPQAKDRIITVVAPFPPGEEVALTVNNGASSTPCGATNRASYIASLKTSLATNLMINESRIIITWLTGQDIYNVYIIEDASSSVSSEDAVAQIVAWAQSGDSVLTGNCVGTVVTSGGTTVVGSSSSGSDSSLIIIIVASVVGLLILLVIILFWKFDLRLRIEKIVGHYHTGSEDPAVAGSSIAMGTPAWVDPQMPAQDYSSTTLMVDEGMPNPAFDDDYMNAPPVGTRAAVIPLQSDLSSGFL